MISDTGSQYVCTLRWMPVHDLSGLQVGTRLGHLLKHATMRLEQLHDDALSPFGINARELAILIAVVGDEPGSQQEVAERIGIDRTSMVMRLDALESKGLVSRHPHAEDRRRNIVELTPLGHDLVRRAVIASDEAERQLLAPLSGSQGARLRESLGIIVMPEPPADPAF